MLHWLNFIRCIMFGISLYTAYIQYMQVQVNVCGRVEGKTLTVCFEGEWLILRGIDVLSDLKKYMIKYIL